MDQNLIRQRMMRGALTGPAEPEKEPTRFCKGKLDNGRPCMIVVIGDEEYCRRHKKEIEALEAGAPLPPGRIERQVPEDKSMAKHHCNKQGCGRSVKKAGDFCWQHKDLADQIDAGMVEKRIETAAVEEHVEHVDGVTDTDGRLLTYRCENESPAYSEIEAETRIGEKVAQPEAVEPADQEPACLGCGGPVNGQDLFCLACGGSALDRVSANHTEEVLAMVEEPADHLADAGKLIGTQISPVAPAPPQEQVDPCPAPQSALSRLLRPAQRPTPPLPPSTIILDFDEWEFAAMQAEGVTAQDLKDLALMLINGELGKIVEAEDPLAKSRIHAAG